jgi:hypothetical protein
MLGETTADDAMHALAWLGWVVEDATTAREDGSKGWVVTGRKHGQRFRAEGATKAEAWRNALIAVRSLSQSQSS